MNLNIFRDDVQHNRVWAGEPTAHAAADVQLGHRQGRQQQGHRTCQGTRAASQKQAQIQVGGKKSAGNDHGHFVVGTVAFVSASAQVTQGLFLIAAFRRASQEKMTWHYTWCCQTILCIILYDAPQCFETGLGV